MTYIQEQQRDRCALGDHEADAEYLTGVSLQLFKVESSPTFVDRPIEGTGISVRLCVHCRSLYAEKKETA